VERFNGRIEDVLQSGFVARIVPRGFTT
jgi:hypothetical protein